MFEILQALGMVVVDMFKSRSRLEAENLCLRHQLAIALRRAPPRLRLHGSDRALLVWLGFANIAVVLSGETPDATPPMVARARPMPLTADDPRYGAPPTQYQQHYDDDRLPLPFPFFIFGR
jgi:hypothetical protein